MLLCRLATIMFFEHLIVYCTRGQKQ